jgi:pyruvate formate lyase activating enzyme
VETCGYTPWPVLDEIRPRVDLFLYDLKLIDSSRHRQWTGVENDLILSNLRKLVEMKHKVLTRIPLIPGINDDEENLRQTAEFLVTLPNVPQVELLPYHNIAEGKYAGLGKNYELTEIRTPEAEQVKKCAARLAEYGLKVI